MLLIFYYYTYLFSSWSLYRFITFFPEAIDEMIFKPLIWLLPLVILIVSYEKRSITKSLGFNFSHSVYDSLFGSLVAIFLFGIVIASLYLRYGTILVNPHDLSLWTLIFFAGMSLATAIVEESVFRGFIMTRLMHVLHSKLWANIIATLLFLLIHLPIYAFTQALNFVEITHILALSGIISFIDGYLFYHRQGIVAPIASHATWNFMAVLIR
ncbi:CPBP family intramembrane metalloprotease [Candidatus Roizmanbacteria bacterium]|nr:CPBP family intramembrane metalloprotease [Candidatus Roizmanbacteria bacterium]